VDGAIADKSVVISKACGSISGMAHEYKFCAWEYKMFLIIT
jgi:hypothetical protein